MKDVLIEIAKTPLPTILVLAGIFFLFLAIAGKFGTSISVLPQKQKLAGLLGGILLIGGVSLYFLRTGLMPPVPQQPQTNKRPPQTQTTDPAPAPAPITAQQPRVEPVVEKPKEITFDDAVDVAKQTNENWLFGNYDEALDGFAAIKKMSNDPLARKLAKKRFKWLEPHRGHIIFADDFEVDTLGLGIWHIHPGFPQEKGSFFQRMLVENNYVLEGDGHHHALAHRLAEQFEKGDIAANFEIHLKFYLVNPPGSRAHINTTLAPDEGRFTVWLDGAEKNIGLFEEMHGQEINKAKSKVFSSRWYALLIIVQERHVQVFIDDKLMLDYESPGSQPLLKNFNLETLSGKVLFDDVLVIAR